MIESPASIFLPVGQDPAKSLLHPTIFVQRVQTEHLQCERVESRGVEVEHSPAEVPFLGLEKEKELEGPLDTFFPDCAAVIIKAVQVSQSIDTVERPLPIYGGVRSLLPPASIRLLCFPETHALRVLAHILAFAVDGDIQDISLQPEKDREVAPGQKELNRLGGVHSHHRRYAAACRPKKVRRGPGGDKKLPQRGLGKKILPGEST